MKRGLLENLNEIVEIDYKKITLERLTEVMRELDREITKQGSNYIIYTTEIGLNQFNRLMKNQHLIETLKKL